MKAERRPFGGGPVRLEAGGILLLKEKQSLEREADS
jgi:hypothetical protein